MELWYGEDQGYRLQFKREDSDTFDMTEEILDPHANSFMIRDLEEFMTYEVKVAAFNNVGSSGYSEAVSDTTREAGELVILCETQIIHPENTLS